MEKKVKGATPDYKGDGVAVWINTDKNGVRYLSIKVLNAFSINAFPYPYPKLEKANQGKL